MRGFEMDVRALRGGFFSLRSLFLIDHFKESPPGGILVAIEKTTVRRLASRPSILYRLWTRCKTRPADSAASGSAWSAWSRGMILQPPAGAGRLCPGCSKAWVACLATTRQLHG